MSAAFDHGFSVSVDDTPGPGTRDPSPSGSSFNPDAQPPLAIDISCPTSPTTITAEHDPRRLVARQSPVPISPPHTPGEDLTAAKYKQWAAYNMSAGVASSSSSSSVQPAQAPVDLAEPVDERSRQFSTASTAPSYDNAPYRESLASSISSGDQPFTPRESHSDAIKIETYDAAPLSERDAEQSPPSHFLHQKEKESPLVGGQKRLWEYRENGGGLANGNGKASGVGLSTANGVHRSLSGGSQTDVNGTPAGVRPRPAISPTRESFDPFAGKHGAITPPAYTGVPRDSSNSYGAARYNPSPYSSLSANPQSNHTGYGASEKAQHVLTSVPTQAQAKPAWSDSTAYWLTWYFAFNLGLTLFNKLVLVNFPFAYVGRGAHSDETERHKADAGMRRL